MCLITLFPLCFDTTVSAEEPAVLLFCFVSVFVFKSIPDVGIYHRVLQKNVITRIKS